MRTLETTPTTRDAVQAFIAGWNAHSPKAVRDAFTADGRLCDPVVPSWTSGEAIEAAVQRALDRYTDVAFTVRSVLEAPDARVVFEWRMTMAVVTSDGRRIPMQLEGVDVCRVRDGKIAELRGYFDRAAIGEQLKAAGLAWPRDASRSLPSPRRPGGSTRCGAAAP